MNFAESMKGTMEMLDWSIRELAERMGNKYSIAYLRDVIDGKPFKEAREDIADALKDGFAILVRDSVVAAKYTKESADSAVKAFQRVVVSLDMSLEHAASLAARSCIRHITDKAV